MIIYSFKYTTSRNIPKICFFDVKSVLILRKKNVFVSTSILRVNSGINLMVSFVPKYVEEDDVKRIDISDQLLILV